jgi:hypothetical protein
LSGIRPNREQHGPKVKVTAPPKKKLALSNWIWKIYHIDIILRSKLCQFVQFEISPSMSHKVFIFFENHPCTSRISIW